MKTIRILDLLTAETARSRGPISRGIFAAGSADDEETSAVDPVGGSRGAGIIRGASLIAIGEALGHGAFVDQVTIDQVVEMSNTEAGVKVRFTHPNESSDGLGSYLGRARNVEAVDGKAIGDVHLSPVSRREGEDRGGYVLDMAIDDPEAFGLSIVFEHDLAAESEFVADHSEVDEEGRAVFTSPMAEMNPDNYPHVRLAALHGVDFVDEPAANADGLFAMNPSVTAMNQADSIFEFVLGLSEECPEETGGLSVDRLRAFASRFLSSRRLQILEERTTEPIEGDDRMSEATETVVETEAVATVVDPGKTEEEVKSELGRYVKKFGAEKGVEYFQAGTSWEAALEAEFDALSRKNALGTSGERGEEEEVGEFADGGNTLDRFDKRLPKTQRAYASLLTMPGAG